MATVSGGQGIPPQPLPPAPVPPPTPVALLLSPLLLDTAPPPLPPAPLTVDPSVTLKSAPTSCEQAVTTLATPIAAPTVKGHRSRGVEVFIRTAPRGGDRSCRA